MNRVKNTIGGDRILPNATYAGGIWNLGEATFYRSYYSSSNATWPTNMITRGLIGYWDANNPDSYPGTGTTWSDLSGNGYTGTLNNGPTYSSSNGGGIVFDGVNDGVSTTYTGNTGNSFTLAFWCKPTAVGQSAGSDLGGKGYAATAPYASYGIDYLSTSKFRYIVADNLAFSSMTGSNTCSINNVYYVALSSLDGLSVGYVNVNGIMTNEGALLNNNLPAYNSQPFNIGYNPLLGANNYFTGSIYVTQLYNVSLTAAEIQQNFDAMRGRFSL